MIFLLNVAFKAFTTTTYYSHVKDVQQEKMNEMKYFLNENVISAFRRSNMILNSQTQSLIRLSVEEFHRFTSKYNQIPL